MRIACISDLHLTEGPRFESTRETLNFCADIGEAENVDLWLVGGDLSGTTVPHRATIREESELATYFRRLARQAPVIICKGNHDSADIGIYGQLAAPHPIAVVEKPTILRQVGTIGKWRAAVYVMPYPQKRWLMAQSSPLHERGDLSIERQNFAYSMGMREILAAWRADAIQAREAGCFTVALMHLLIGGAKAGGGEVMLIGREIELSPYDISDLGVDVALLGHIHLHQQITDCAWYIGNQCAQNFGEVDEKGMLIVEIPSPGEPPIIQRVRTPARRMVTVSGELVAADDQWAINYDKPIGNECVDAEVRLELRVPEEAATLSIDVASRFIRVFGAASLKVERRIIPRARIRSPASARAQTPSDHVIAYWDSLGEGAPPPIQQNRALALLAEIEGEQG